MQCRRFRLPDASRNWSRRSLWKLYTDDSAGSVCYECFIESTDLPEPRVAGEVASGLQARAGNPSVKTRIMIDAQGLPVAACTPRATSPNAISSSNSWLWMKVHDDTSARGVGDTAYDGDRLAASSWPLKDSKTPALTTRETGGRIVLSGPRREGRPCDAVIERRRRVERTQSPGSYR